MWENKEDIFKVSGVQTTLYGEKTHCITEESHRGLDRSKLILIFAFYE